MEDKVLHLGIVKAQGKEKGLCHCNSFITTYVAERDYDILYRDLSHSYEITKIVREDKITKQAEVIYQSEQASLRENQVSKNAVCSWNRTGRKVGKIYYEAECKIWRISYAGYAFGYRTAYEEMP